MYAVGKTKYGHQIENGARQSSHSRYKLSLTFVASDKVLY